MTLDGFLHPALALVNRMRFSRKFGILFALIFVPLVLLAGYLIHEQNSSIDFVESERHGLAYIEAVREPIEYLQQHRGAMGAVLAGSNDAGERARRLRRLTDETLADLEEVDREVGDRLETGDRVASIKGRWEALRSDVDQLRAAESFERHTDLVDKLISLMRRVADTSNITLDPELDTYYLGDAVVNRLMAQAEIMGQIRALITEAASAGTLDADQRTQLAVLINNMERQHGNLTEGFQAALNANPTLENRLEEYVVRAATAVDTFSALAVDEFLEAQTIGVDSTEAFDTATEAISEVFRLYDTVTPVLDELFLQRID